MELFDSKDLTVPVPDVCRCRCTDNHPIANGTRMALVCVLKAPAGEQVCEPCRDAMVSVYG